MTFDPHRRRFLAGVAGVAGLAAAAQIPADRATATPRPAGYPFRFFDGDRRGYVRCEVRRSDLRAELRVVPTVSRPDAPESVYARFTVEDGHPGAVRTA